MLQYQKNANLTAEEADTYLLYTMTTDITIHNNSNNPIDSPIINPEY